MHIYLASLLMLGSAAPEIEGQDFSSVTCSLYNERSEAAEGNDTSIDFLEAVQDWLYGYAAGRNNVSFMSVSRSSRFISALNQQCQANSDWPLTKAAESAFDLSHRES